MNDKRIIKGIRHDKTKLMFFSLDTPFKVALIYSNNRAERKRLDIATITSNKQRSCYYEKLKEYEKQYDFFTFVYEPKENRVIINFTDKWEPFGVEE